MRTKVLEGLVEFVARIFGPVGSQSADLRIGIKQIAHIRADIRTDRRAGQTPGLGHAIVRELAIGQARHIFFAQPRRPGSVNLKIHFHTPCDRAVDEFTDDMPVLFCQVIDFARGVGRVAIKLLLGLVTGAAAHPQSAFAPQRPVKKPRAAAGVGRRLVRAFPLIAGRGYRRVTGHGRGSTLFQIVEHALDAFIEDKIAEYCNAQKALHGLFSG